MNKEKDTFGCLFLILGRKKIVCKGMQFDEKEGTMVDFFFEVC